MHHRATTSGVVHLSETAFADRQDGRPAGGARLVLLILKALAEAVHTVSVRTILGTHRILARICKRCSWPRRDFGSGSPDASSRAFRRQARRSTKTTSQTCRRGCIRDVFSLDACCEHAFQQSQGNAPLHIGHSTHFLAACTASSKLRTGISTVHYIKISEVADLSGFGALNYTRAAQALKERSV
jgi:hypothetical protein